MGVSINGSTPIAGWFICWKIPTKNGWFGASHLWKLGNIWKPSISMLSLLQIGQIFHSFFPTGPAPIGNGSEDLWRFRLWDVWWGQRKTWKPLGAQLQTRSSTFGERDFDGYQDLSRKKSKGNGNRNLKNSKKGMENNYLYRSNLQIVWL